MLLFIVVLAGIRVEILHADGLGDPLLEIDEDVLTGHLAKDGARGVEIPVVAVEEGAGFVAAAFGTVRGHARMLGRCHVIDAG